MLAKTKFKPFAVLACVVFVLLAVFCIGNVEAEEVLYSGTCGAEEDGSNVTWSFSDKGTLTISGKGEMADFGWGWIVSEQSYQTSAPWEPYAYDVKTVVVEEGVTNIGEGAFCGLFNMTEATIADSVTAIEEAAFCDCHMLKSIDISSNVESIRCEWYGGAFSNCYDLENINVSKDNEFYKSIDGVLYTKDGTTLLQYTNGKKQTEFTVPEGVTDIADYAFTRCSNLRKLTIANDVVNIGRESVYWCYGLNEVVIGDNVKKIGESAFSYSSLRTVMMGRNVEYIGDSAFYDTNLGSIELPDGIRYIGDGAFDETGVVNMYWLDEIYIGNYLIKVSNNVGENYTVKDGTNLIAGGAFELCKKLKDITIPDSVETICANAFYNSGIYNDASNWENDVLYIGDFLIKAKNTISGGYTVKDGTTLIASRAFDNCYYLTELVIADSVKNINAEAVYQCNFIDKLDINGVSTIRQDMFVESNWINELIIGDGVTEIGDHAFEGYSGLTSVTIGDNVTTIGDYAFSACNYLETVTLGKNLTNIGEYAFRGCVELNEIAFENNVKSVGDGAFSDCYSLNTVRVSSLEVWCGISFASESANPIGYGDEFYMNGKLVTELVIPDGITSIGDYSFSGYSLLTTVTIPESVTYIGKGAFKDSEITSVTIPGTVKNIGENAFSGCHKLNTLTIEDGVENIGNCAFQWCYSLVSVTIPDSVIAIGEEAFYACTKLANVTIGSGVTVIEKGTFQGTAITELVIPDNVVIIGDYAFLDCNKLTKVVIGSGVKNIVDNPFVRAYALNEFKVSENNPYYKAVDGVLYTNDGKTLVCYANGKNEPTFTVPNGVEVIGVYSFAFRDVEVILPETLRKIDEWAFTNSHITSITIPEGVTLIDSGAFYTSSLESIVFVNTKNWVVCYPDNDMKRIKLSSEEFEDSEAVADLIAGSYAGGRWKQITVTDSGYCGGEGDGTNLTYTLYGDGVLVIEGEGKMEDFQSSYYTWGRNLKKVYIADGVTSIGEYAFYYCNQLTEINIPYSVTYIGDYAFYSCYELDVTLPDTVTYVGYMAFAGSGITSVDLTNCTIETYAFQGSELVTVKVNNCIINSNAFAYSSNLSTVVIGKDTKSISAYAFNGCGYIDEIIFEKPDGWVLFDNESIYYVFEDELANSEAAVEYVRQYNDYEWKCATSIVDFGYCSAGGGLSVWWELDDLGVLSICGSGEMSSYADSLYDYGEDVIAIVIEDGITKIYDHAFSGLNCVKLIKIGEDVYELSGAAFPDCYALRYVYLDNENYNYSVIDGSLYDYNGNTLIKYASAEQQWEVKIPDGVVCVGDYALAGVELASITIPKSVTQIGKYALYSYNVIELVFENTDGWWISESMDATEGTSVDVSDSSTAATEYLNHSGYYWNHSHVYSELVTEPTCTEEGYTTHTCGCGDSYNDSVVASLGHIEAEATCTEDAVCERCGDTVEEALGHDMKPATCFVPSTCSRCGTTDGEPLVHNFADGKCANGCGTLEYCAEFENVGLTVGKDLTIKYSIDIINKFAREDLSKVSIKFTMNGKTVTVQLDESKLDVNGNFVFEFSNIAPQCMNDNIKAEVVYDGVVYESKAEYSVKNYIDALMTAYSEDKEMVQLLVDLMEYGAAAQKYAGHNTDNLINSGNYGKPSENLPEKSEVVTSMTNNSANTGKARILGATVRFDYINRIGLRIYGYQNARLFVNGVEVELTGEIYYTDGIHATEFDKVFTFELYVGDTLVQTFTYSVTSYIYSQMNKKSNGELTAMAELARSLYRYGESAKAYAKAHK